MKLRSMDPEEAVWDVEDSEDVMDLDHTEVLSLLDINHEQLPRDEGVGFDMWLEDRLEAMEQDDELQRLLDEIDNELDENGDQVT